jgi:carbamoyl-phosphate synthase large subunit
VQELVHGDEYTVNCYFDPACRLRAAVPHRRISTRSGEVSRGRTERVAELARIARLLENPRLGLRGAACFQAIISPEGGAKLFEINARFGGGYPLAHRAGARFTSWLIAEALGLAPAYTDDWEAGHVMLRYDQSFFFRE